MSTFTLKLRERPFEAIKKGTKNIEIRANTNEHTPNSVSMIRAGNIIIFKKENTNEKLKCSVERIMLYPGVRELLLAEGTKHTLSSTNDIEEGIKSVESIGNYKEVIAKNGVFAIKIKDIEVL